MNNPSNIQEKTTRVPKSADIVELFQTPAHLHHYCRHHLSSIGEGLRSKRSGIRCHYSSTTSKLAPTCTASFPKWIIIRRPYRHSHDFTLQCASAYVDPTTLILPGPESDFPKNMSKLSTIHCSIARTRQICSVSSSTLWRLGCLYPGPQR